MTANYGLYIDNAFTDSGASARIPIQTPATGQLVGTLANASSDDVNRAVESAHRAFRETWGTATPKERARLLLRLADIIEERADDLAKAEVADNGKLFREMRAQLGSIPNWYRYFAGLADKLEGKTIPMDRDSLFVYTRKEPFGVVGCITAWNSPLLLATYKLAPALAAGNTAVVKPSEHASVSTLLLAECFADAGFPPGVVNVITGDGATAGAELVAHPLVKKLAFTGSGGGGRAVALGGAQRMVPVTLELGGKSPSIVFDDADLDVAATGILSGIFAASGQTCVAGSRALVHRSIYAELTERIVERARNIVIGDPNDPSTEMGPIANTQQFRAIQEHVSMARQDGLRLLTGGRAATLQSPHQEGLFFEPTVFADVEPHHRLFREEVFGPVLALTPFDTDDEALAIANDSSYGLSAGVWTKDLSRAQRFSRAIEAGTVWINTYRMFAPAVPFGGYKDSGLGSENGIDAIGDYLQTKTVWIESEPDAGDPFTMKL